jgi:pimeloyl-ACP methyl ester carboxylesterase
MQYLQSMTDYSTRVTNLIRNIRAEELAIGLKDTASCSRFFVHSQPSNRVLLFFHGFTSAPQQFVSIAEAFFQSGDNVLIPRLPGHGLAGVWNRNHPPPLPDDVGVYQRFGMEWLEYAQALGKQVIVGGLSGGANLAAWLSFERPESVDQALLFAPYLANTNSVLDWLVRTLRIYFRWKPEPGTHHFGYEGFCMPALRVWLELGDMVLKQAETLPSVPFLIVSSEADVAVNLSQHRRLFQAALNTQPNCWHVCFNEKLGIPHNMMNKIEGNPHEEWVTAIAKAYVYSNLPWVDARSQIQLIEQGQWSDHSLCSALTAVPSL